MDAVAELWTKAPWLIYLVGVLLFAFALLVVHARYERARAAGTPKPMSDIMLPVTFAVSTAVFGSMCVVSAKAMGTPLPHPQPRPASPHLALPRAAHRLSDRLNAGPRRCAPDRPVAAPDGPSPLARGAPQVRL